MRGVTATLVLTLAACSTAGGDATTTTSPADASTTTTEAAPETVSIDSAEKTTEALLSLLSDGEIDEAAALWSDSWIQVGIPMTEGDTAARPPATPADGLRFISAWMTFDAEECIGTPQGATVEVRCLVTVSGPFQEALGVVPFPLPLASTVGTDGLIWFGTDYNAISDGSFEETDETRQYTQALVEFYRYAFEDQEFSSAHSEGVGRPVISLESAAAHISMAQQWTDEGGS